MKNSPLKPTPFYFPKIFCFLLLLSSCGVEDQKNTNPYRLIAEIRGDESLDRTWVEPTFRKVASLSKGDKYTLHNPVSLEIYDDDRLYVVDAGDYRVKAFTLTGTYISTYGQGRGRGPGHVMTLTDGGIWRDSLVYLVDPRQRRVSYFQKNGSFVQTESYDFSFYRLAWTRDSTKYMVSPGRPSDPFMWVETRDRRFSIDRPPIPGLDKALYGGVLQTSREKAIYVPRYLPVLLVYSSTDTIGAAYPTPDYGLSLPKLKKEDNNSAAPSAEIHQAPTVQNGILSVQRPTPKADTLVFDLYDIGRMKYMHSIRLPVEDRKSVYGYETGTVASVRDTTVEIYEVDHPQK